MDIIGIISIFVFGFFSVIFYLSNRHEQRKKSKKVIKKSFKFLDSRPDLLKKLNGNKNIELQEEIIFILEDL